MTALSSIFFKIKKMMLCKVSWKWSYVKNYFLWVLQKVYKFVWLYKCRDKLKKIQSMDFKLFEKVWTLQKVLMWKVHLWDITYFIAFSHKISHKMSHKMSHEMSHKPPKYVIITPVWRNFAIFWYVFETPQKKVFHRKMF